MESTFAEKFKKLKEGMASLTSEAHRLQSGRAQSMFAWSKEQRIQLAAKYEQMKEIKKQLRKVHDEAIQTSLRFQKARQNLLQIPERPVQTRGSKRLKINGLLQKQQHTQKHQQIKTTDVEIKKKKTHSKTKNDRKKLDHVHDTKTEIISHIDIQETQKVKNTVILNDKKEQPQEIDNQNILSIDSKQIQDIEKQIISNNDTEQILEMDNEVIPHIDSEETQEIDNQVIMSIDDTEQILEMDNEVIPHIDSEETQEIENKVIMSNDDDTEQTQDIENQIILNNDTEEAPEMDNEVILTNDSEEILEIENGVILSKEQTQGMENQNILNNENDETQEIENHNILSNETEVKESNDGDKIISVVPEILENEFNGQTVNPSIMTTTKRSLQEDEKQEKKDVESPKKIKLDSYSNSHTSFPVGNLFFLADVASSLIQETSSNQHLHRNMLRKKNDADHSFQCHNEMKSSNDVSLEKIEETNDSNSTTQEEVHGLNREINEEGQSSLMLVKQVDDVIKEVIEEKKEYSSPTVTDKDGDFQQDKDDDEETDHCSDAETIDDDDDDISQEIFDNDMDHSIQTTAKESTIEPNPKFIIQEEEEASSSKGGVDQAVSFPVQNEEDATTKTPEINAENNTVVKENSILSNLKPKVSSNFNPDSDEEEKLVPDFPENSNDESSNNKLLSVEDDSCNLLCPGVHNVNNITEKETLPLDSKINHEEILDFSDDSNSSVSSSYSNDYNNTNEVKKVKRTRRSHKSLEVIVEKKLKQNPARKEVINVLKSIQRYLGKTNEELFL